MRYGRRPRKHTGWYRQTWRELGSDAPVQRRFLDDFEAIHRDGRQQAQLLTPLSLQSRSRVLDSTVSRRSSRSDGLCVQRWLSGFAHRVQLAPSVLVASGLMALGVVALTVAAVASSAARARPDTALRFGREGLIDIPGVASKKATVQSSEIVEMLRPRERYIYMYRFQPTVRSEKINPPTALDLMKALQVVVLAGKAFEDVKLEGDYLPTRTAVKAMEIDDSSKTATVLFSVSDPRLSDPVFEHIPTGKQRTAAKKADEGVSFACHMVLSLKLDKHGTYPMALEEVPYLSRSRIVPFLKRLVRESSYEFVEEDENGNHVSYQPGFEVNGDLSQRLEDELKDGVVKDILLARRTKIGHGLDEDGYYRETARQIKLKLDESGKRSFWTIIEKLRELAKKQGMDMVKVRYVRDDEKSRTIKYRTDQGGYDPRDAVNVRCELLEFGHDLPNSRDSIDQKLQAKMRKLLSPD